MAAAMMAKDTMSRLFRLIGKILPYSGIFIFAVFRVAEIHFHQLFKNHRIMTNYRLCWKKDML